MQECRRLYGPYGFASKRLLPALERDSSGLFFVDGSNDMILYDVTIMH